MIKETKFKQKIYSFEFVDNVGEYHCLYFNDSNYSELKNKVKEYKKNGTITFVSINGNSINNNVFAPKYIRISRVLEMYKKEEENVEDISAQGTTKSIQDTEVS